MENTTNIFESACLLQLSISIWGENKRTIDKKKVNKALNSEWTSGSKNLIDRDAISKMTAIRSAARKLVESYATPFPIHGVSIIHFGFVERVDRGLQELSELFNNYIPEFKAIYPELQKQAKEKLEPAGLYNPTDYPDNIENYFRFSWKFITIAAPTENSVLSPDIIKREQQKFYDTIEEAKVMASAAITEEFKKLVDNLVERMTPDEDGKQKRFKKNVIENFSEFFETFKTKNKYSFNNDELQKIVDKAQKIIGNVDPETLRSNDAMRESLQQSMGKVSKELDNSIEKLPTRKLTFRD